MVTETDIAAEREELKTLIRERAFKHDNLFRTPSGIENTYFDFLEISLKHKGVQLAGDLVYNEIKDLDIQALGGPSHGTASIICRAAYLKEIGVFYIRDTMRQEGNIHALKWIESRIKAGDRVALVGDVVASGGTMIRSIQEVHQLAGEIAKIIVIIDRQTENGVEKIKKFLKVNMLDVPVKVLFTREEIVGEG